MFLEILFIITGMTPQKKSGFRKHEFYILYVFLYIFNISDYLFNLENSSTE